VTRAATYGETQTQLPFYAIAHASPIQVLAGLYHLINYKLYIHNNNNNNYVHAYFHIWHKAIITVPVTLGDVGHYKKTQSLP